MESRNTREIDAGALEDNMRAIRAAVPPTARVLAVVKADGYGHGAETVSRAALAGGADMLAVASVSEGIKLRAAGIDAGILVLGAVTAWDVREGVENRLIQTVCSPDMVDLCARAARETGLPAEVHLKVDTGMGRIGVRDEAERDAVLREIRRCPEARWPGVFPHFSKNRPGGGVLGKKVKKIPPGKKTKKKKKEEKAGRN